MGKKKMNVEVLVSTMNQTDYTLLEKMNINTDAVVVNQCGIDEKREFKRNGYNVKWINSSAKGLSVSRNICLNEASGDICLLADDDLEYVERYEKLVLEAFEKHKGTSIIRFKVNGIEREFKSYPNKESSVGRLKSLKTSSVEIAFLRKSLQGIRFDELIGAGTKFCMGEENAFLMHCLRKGLKMYYVPETISNLHIGDSSWKNISSEQYFMARGAAFEAMETRLVHLLIFQFAVRKRKIFKRSLSVRQRIKLMESGRKEYIETKKHINEV